ncbi:MAG: TlpA disulfide reductase family protein [Myxococcota bacterium]
MQKLSGREGLMWVMFLAIATAMVVALSVQGGDSWMGRQAPALALPDTDGNLVELDKLRDQVVILNVYATWCGPCKMEIPDLASFHQRNREKGRPVQLYGVVYESGPAAQAAADSSALGVNYPILMGSGPVFERYALRSYPTTIVVDTHGHIIARHEGLVDLQMLEDWTMAALHHAGHHH